MTPIKRFTLEYLGADMPAPRVLTDGSTWAVFRVEGGDERSIHYTLKELLPVVATTLSDDRLSPADAARLLFFAMPDARVMAQFVPVFEEIVKAFSDDGKISRAEAMSIGIALARAIARVS